jgi:hypothetical protein
LLASGKAGAAEAYADNAAFLEVQKHVTEVCQQHPDIARKVRDAARYGIKGANLRRCSAGAAPTMASGPSTATE